MTKTELLSRLRAGTQPKEMGGKEIGAGSFRRAYKVGRWVVKEYRNHGASPQCMEGRKTRLRAVGVRIAPTKRIGRWQIQLFYPLVPAQHPKLLDAFKALGPWGTDDSPDFGYGNVGLDSRGRLVAFDW